MEYEDATNTEALRAALVEAWEEVAKRSLWAIGLFVCGVIAVLQGEVIGHVLGVLGLVFAWLVREPLREALRLRAVLREQRDPDRPNAN